MPNYVKNVIQLGQSVPQDRIEALYKAVLNTQPKKKKGGKRFLFLVFLLRVV